MTEGPGKRRRIFTDKPRSRRGLPISLVVVAVIAVIFWLIPPLHLDTGPFIPRDLPLPTPGPTRTRVPRPTGVHGGRIVFTCTRGDYNQICMINADGSGFQQWTNDERNSYYPVFTPEGGAVVFASNQGGDFFDFYLLVLGKSEFVRMTYNVGNAFSPSFSPDGEQLAFVNQAGEEPASIWAVGRNGEDPHRLYTGSDAIVAVKWSPLGDRVAFAMSIGGTFAYEIYLLDLQHLDQPPRKLPINLTAIGGSLDWSLDGASLLVHAGPVAEREIYRVDTATGAASQLTFEGSNAAAAYSPDGKWIAYNSASEDDRADIFVMDAEGRNVRRLTQDPEPDWQPQWEP